MSDRDSIRELLPSHRQLLERHQDRLAWMAQVAKLDIQKLGGIIANTRGEFGDVAAEAGECFVVADPDEGDVVVLALGLQGLIDIAAAVVPEAVPHILDRLPSTMPILVVDGDDEPALVIVSLNELRFS